ncbi:MAG: Rrf2 family transcriptional regulator [Dehalococcoidales bacterium]
MRLTQRADYAVRMMVDLAGSPDNQRVSIGNIARRQSLPEPFMAKIASQVAAAGLLDTWRGKGGGLAMARPADEINLLQIIESIDGPLALNRCTYEPSQCPDSDTCPVHPIWKKAQQQLNDLMSGSLLSEMVLSSDNIENTEN